MQIAEKKMKFRHELKYYLSMADCLTIQSRLSRIAQHDENCGENGTYRIRSLYFETPDDKVLTEKLYGIMEREKFRIRFYNGSTSFIRLEKKLKINTLSSKVTCRITKDEVEKILAGDYEWMRDSGRALLLELYVKMKYEQLRPRTIVDYDRESFIYAPGNVRVTLDTNIQTGVSSTDLFNPETPVVKAHGVPVIIMEVKYDNFLPAIIKCMVQMPNRRVTAFSKYAVARVFG
ncbi:MAG: polyphosphate polymerase domain-containing protein [Methanocorpusculum sp.]|nr:polyphosphate polymerase domain-containing protein [Methanocorpusculum sp.]